MYTIIKAPASPIPDGDLHKPVWQQAAELTIGEFPWYKGGTRQQTMVRAAYDDVSLYLLYVCEDRHISVSVTELNGPVSSDSCVEFFASPEPEQRPHYFNLEFNACGCLLVGYGPDRYERTRIGPDLARQITVYHSVPGPVKQESPEDNGWVLEAVVPFKVLEEFCGVRVPGKGTVWKANFYRCGGKTDPQYAAWAPVDTPRPDFHRPACFGEILFQ